MSQIRVTKHPIWSKTGECEIYPGYSVELPMIYEVFDVLPENRAIRIDISGNSGSGVQVESFAVISLDGQPVTASEWRMVSPYEIWEKIGEQIISAVSPLTVQEISNLRTRGISNPDTLQFVADMYGLAEAVKISPNKFVQKMFSANGQLDSLPRPTASKWIKAAKEQGLIKSSKSVTSQDLEVNRRKYFKEVTLKKMSENG